MIFRVSAAFCNNSEALGLTSDRPGKVGDCASGGAFCLLPISVAFLELAWESGFSKEAADGAAFNASGNVSRSRSKDRNSLKKSPFR